MFKKFFSTGCYLFLLLMLSSCQMPTEIPLINTEENSDKNYDTYNDDAHINNADYWGEEIRKVWIKLNLKPGEIFIANVTIKIISFSKNKIVLDVVEGPEKDFNNLVRRVLENISQSRQKRYQGSYDAWEQSADADYIKMKIHMTETAMTAMLEEVIKMNGERISFPKK